MTTLISLTLITLLLALWLSELLARRQADAREPGSTDATDATEGSEGSEEGGSRQRARAVVTRLFGGDYE